MVCLLSAEEEETLLNDEDHMSHHSGGSTKRDMTKRDILSIFDVLWKPQYNRAIVAVIAVMLAQQLCGMLTLQSIFLPNLSPSSGHAPSSFR